MKNNFIYTCIIILGVLNSCKKIPNGNLSNIIRYETLPIEVPQGRSYVSDALNPEGSTKPLHIKLLNVYNKNSGEDVTDIFLQKYNFTVWTGLYDSRVDTTLELIDAKQKDSLIYPISINSVSGQLEANYTTINLPLGEFSFDLEISNEAGSAIYKEIGEFEIVEAPFYEIPTVRSTVAMMVGNESTTKTITSNSSHLVVEKISDDENKIIVRILDKNGNPFNPIEGEIVRRPNTGTTGGYLQTMQDYSIESESFEDRMEFIYGVVPFPLASLGNGFNYYYRIPAQYVVFDASLGLPYNTYSCNARFSFQTFTPGTYKIDVIVPQVTRFQ